MPDEGRSNRRAWFLGELGLSTVGVLGMTSPYLPQKAGLVN